MKILLIKLTLAVAMIATNMDTFRGITELGAELGVRTELTR